MGGRRPPYNLSSEYFLLTFIRNLVSRCAKFQNFAKSKVSFCNILVIYTAMGKIFVIAPIVQKKEKILSKIAMIKILPFE